MIALKEFIQAIHDAIIQSHDSLMTSNVGVLDEFFNEVDKDGKIIEKKFDEQGNQTNKGIGEALAAKTVIVEYPVLTASGDVDRVNVYVPLITLVPLSVAQIETANLSIDFNLEFADNALQLTFAKQSKTGGESTKNNRMEISIAPQEPPDGLKILVEGYEAVLKRQMP